ncbi:hypothetical protein D9757_002288 [Collybiopsis confluens]|uniref:DNA replication regulator Sld3 C-terminal domain-containing protein n=1 Tax=Collybiopsis confluens TaxID=2823264 RepID=A0A8H5HZX9_9AGAR|nr:hypothetical protein D9757_002288 [Collybiopsis confluens]
MAQACISKLPHNIDFQPRFKWPSVQEEALNQDFPFSGLDHETLDQFAVRTYLQFLWLPELIMPLKLLVPAMRRVQVASTSSESMSSPHPLHALLDPILLGARTSANKYQVELPKILDNQGGDEDIEEMMMWYALSFEKALASKQDIPVYMDEQWRAKWIKRMERREVCIQILLNLLLLSLPGPRPVPLEPKIPQLSSVKRRKQPIKKAASVPTPEERLESFMDKLSMLQLMGDLENCDQASRPTPRPNNELNWAQSFCQNIIEPSFQSTLPIFCDLFRSKVFPSTLFSDEEDQDAEELAVSRQPSPALSTSSTSSQSELKRQDPLRRQLQRERSRSLSISLAEEAEQKAKQGVSGPTKRRMFSREVSMSFRARSKTPSLSLLTMGSSFLISNSRKDHNPRLVKREPTGTVLVEATPLKPVRTMALSQVEESYNQIAVPALFSRTTSKSSNIDKEEDLWELPGSTSPQVLSLTPIGKVTNAETLMSTPTKAKRKRL